MNTFNNKMPGDLITLEMRIKEDVRHVMKAMFISSEDRRKLLEDAIESSIINGNILNHIEKEARNAISESVTEYFKFGEGGMALRKSINDVLHEIIPKIFNDDIKKNVRRTDDK